QSCEGPSGSKSPDLVGVFFVFQEQFKRNSDLPAQPLFQRHHQFGFDRIGNRFAEVDRYARAAFDAANPDIVPCMSAREQEIGDDRVDRVSLFSLAGGKPTLLRLYVPRILAVTQVKAFAGGFVDLSNKTLC